MPPKHKINKRLTLTRLMLASKLKTSKSIADGMREQRNDTTFYYILAHIRAFVYEVLISLCFFLTLTRATTIGVAHYGS